MRARHRLLSRISWVFLKYCQLRPTTLVCLGYRPALCREILLEWILLHRLEPGNYAGRIQLSAFRTCMRVIRAEELLHTFWPQFLILIGNDLRQIDESYALRLRDSC